MVKTIYFYGLNKLSLWSSLILLSPSVMSRIDYDYHFGALRIDFDLRDRKIVGQAIAKARKLSNFRRVYNP